MLVASVDTATLTLSCALVEIDESGVHLIAEKTEPPPSVKARGGQPTSPATSAPTAGHSGRLPAALTELLEMVERRLGDIEGYALGLGPGSFTGLRIGLATWKGLAYANRRPIAGASSLEALAMEAAARVPSGTRLVPLLDAKKGEIYAGFYRVTNSEEVTRLAPEAALSPSALLDRLAALGPAVGFGEGYQAHREPLSAHLPGLVNAPISPSAFHIARLAAARLWGATFDAPTLYALEPQYVRLSEAEVKYPHGLDPGALKQ